ncbi:methylated-DNA--[protein]-cysteine S-methyltransferase [Urechidicola sp. KH5]
MYIETPLGIAKISGDQEGIAEISVLEDEHTTPTPINEMPNYLKLAAIQLKEYFNGSRTSFDLKLQPQGTPFQKKVWNALLDIPYGRTRTYSEQTKHLGDIKAIRAVANANGKNPLWIVVPCHRVVGSDGSLTGYAGGISRKKWLLEHESGSKQQSLF